MSQKKLPLRNWGTFLIAWFLRPLFTYRKVFILKIKVSLLCISYIQNIYVGEMGPEVSGKQEEVYCKILYNSYKKMVNGCVRIKDKWINGVMSSQYSLLGASVQHCFFNRKCRNKLLKIQFAKLTFKFHFTYPIVQLLFSSSTTLVQQFSENCVSFYYYYFYTRLCYTLDQLFYVYGKF